MRNAPALQPTLWYGMPGYAKDGKTVFFFRADRKYMTFGFTQEANLSCQGSCVADPSGLFNSSLDGNVRRAIDIHEGDKVDEAALKDLIRAAVALNLKGKSTPKPRRSAPSF